MALALDGTPASGTFSAAGTKVLALTTTTSDDVIVVIVANEKATADSSFTAVTGIADDAGLTWTRHKQFQWSPTSGNATRQDMEVWWAHAPAPLTANNITVTCANTDSTGSHPLVTDDGCAVAFAVSGANFTTPFDANASIPGTSSDVSGASVTAQVTGLTTNASDIFAIMMQANAQGINTSTQTGWTSIASLSNFGGSLEEQLDVDYQIFSSALSGTTVAFPGTSNNFGMIVTAIRIFTAAEADVVAAPDMGFDVAAAIQNEKSFTVAPDFGFSEAAAVTFEADLAASPAMGFSVFASFDDAQFLAASPDFGAALAAAITMQFFGAAAPAFGFDMAATVTAQRELAVAASLGFVERARMGATTRRQPVVCVIT